MIGKMKVKYYDGKPGGYYCRCVYCEERFIGDKRDCVCPECEERHYRAFLDHCAKEQPTKQVEQSGEPCRYSGCRDNAITDGYFCEYHNGI